MKIFRENTFRRKLLLNVPLLCETHWSSKYKNIREFSENFNLTMKSLKLLLNNDGFSNSNTR